MILALTLYVLCCTLVAGSDLARAFDQRSIVHAAQNNSCARTCDGIPRTCYFYFHVEQYSTMGWSCNSCQSQDVCQCILADGVERSMYSANRKLPGPKIEVCEGDKVVVDVENRIEGLEMTIHWHGVWQDGTQYADGVPYVTQCPILSHNNFRYIWYAKNPGTHFWHAHTGLQKMDGLAGPIVIRQTAARDYHSSLYRNDLSAHTVMVNDWWPYFASMTLPGALRRPSLIGELPHSLLINGKGQTRHPDTNVMTTTPLEEFTVFQGQTYRFRLINAMGTVCPIIFTIDQHKLLAIASDGEPFQSVVVDGIQSYSAERYDFILTANKSIGSYWIRVRAVGICASEQLQQLAILRYSTAAALPTAPRPSYNTSVPQGVMLNDYTRNCADGFSNAICLNHLKSLRPIDYGVLGTPNIKLYLPFGTYFLPEQQVFKPNQYRPFMVIGTGAGLVTHRIDGVEYAPPPSPIISQYFETPPTQFCNRNKNCVGNCTCTHKIDIPLNAIVEIILADDSEEALAPHNMHLHGYAFNVMGIGVLPNDTRPTLDKVKDLDSKGLLQRRFVHPAFKDTLTVPIRGYAVIRFNAKNAGLWFMHCHYGHHLVTGMSLVLQVGSDYDIPPIPANFPKCGHFQPPY
ncbi:laccase-4-like [Photinus pyralis]|uniref:Laccase n=1 Tax=Photinus pyralis TaxID=7054 RepID=A0A1Y1LYK2_PHOPY|nr:laccase-4-like [Photinus pyralis]XP_031351624.1 laccase-4-like [Photinus pyralis]